jgi:hypothetical protein
VVFDEYVFPFSASSTTPPDPDLDPFSLFPTDTVVQPPFPWSLAGTTSPPSLPDSCPRSPTARGSVGPGQSSSGAAPASPRDEGPGASSSGAAPAPSLDAGSAPSSSGAAPAPPLGAVLGHAPPTWFAEPVRCTSAIRGRPHRSRPLLHRGLRHHRHSPRLPASYHRSTTRRFFSDTRGMFTRC